MQPWHTFHKRVVLWYVPNQTQLKSSLIKKQLESFVKSLRNNSATTSDINKNIIGRFENQPFLT